MAVLLTIPGRDASAQPTTSPRPSAETILFPPVGSNVDLPSGVREGLRQIRGLDPTATDELIVVQSRGLAVTRSMLSRSTAERGAGPETQQVSIILPNARVITTKGISFKDLGGGRSSWIGSVTSDTTNQANVNAGTVVITTEGSRALGSISLLDQKYALTPLGQEGEFAAIYKVEEGRTLKPEEPPQNLKFKKRTEAPQEPSTTNIRILLAYTPTAERIIASQNATLGQYAAQLIAESNATFIGSKVNVSYELASLMPVSYTETGDWVTDRDRFFLKGGNYSDMDAVFDERDKTKADIAVLLTGDNTYCGEAETIHANSEEAFAVVDVEPFCRNKFTFTHETVHLLGGEHDPPHASNPPYKPYGHGYITGQQTWRTMMAYDTDCSPCTRILRLSSPLLRYPDDQGEVLGTANEYDNARVVKEEAEAVSKFK